MEFTCITIGQPRTKKNLVVSMLLSSKTCFTTLEGTLWHGLLKVMLTKKKPPNPKDGSAQKI